MIWMLFALGYNLLLGPPACRRSATAPIFGIGAYAFGLLQQGCGPTCGSTWPARSLAAALVGALVAAVHLAPARHLLRAAHHRLRPGVLVRRDQVAQRHRRRGRAAQHQAARCELGFATIGLQSNEALFYLRARACSPSSSLALWRLVHSPFGRVLRAIKQNETRAAFVGYNVWLYKWLRLHDLRAPSRASPARCSRWRSSRPIPT